MSLTDSERRLAAKIGFEEVICELVKQHVDGSLDRLTAYDEEFHVIEADGLSVAIDNVDVGPIITSLQPKLLARGYRAFWSSQCVPPRKPASDEIAVLKSTDQYAIIRLRRANGGNYDVSTDNVIAKLKNWETKCQFEIVGARGDSVAIAFKSLPVNICAFAEEIYDFCPDTVEQGVGLLNEKDHRETFQAARKLCPELSNEMNDKLAAKQQQFQKMELPTELRAMFASGKTSFTTTTDMGIRLLAHSLKDTMFLNLWWD